MKNLFFYILLFLFFFIKINAKYMIKNQKKTYNNYKSIQNNSLNIRIYTLKNGLKVFLSRNTNTPRIQTLIPIRTGSAKDPRNNTGLAHYLEHMLFKGTSKIGTNNWEKEKPLINQISNLYEKHKNESNPKIKKEIYTKINNLSQEAAKFAIPSEYDQLLTLIGAKETNAYTSFDETVYINNIPSNELERWLCIEKERFSELVLRLFHTEIESVYEEFNRSQDNDDYLINNTLLKSLFPTHSYGLQTTIGCAKHLKNPSMEAIHKFFKKYYVPNNMAIILVGNLEYDNTIQLIEKYFGKFKKQNIKHNTFKKEKPISSVIKCEVFSPEPENITFGFRLETNNKKDLLMLEIIDMILYNSKAGLIDLNLIHKQKVYDAMSSIQLYKDYVIHRFFGMPKKNQSLEEIKNLILKEIHNIKNGNFENWIIKAVINDLELKTLKERESNYGLAAQLVESFIHNESYENYINKFNEMRKISKKELIDFAKKIYQDNNYAIIYKKKGENKHLVKVDNPKITPIKINRNQNSIFFKKIEKIPVTPIYPEFIDYNKKIKKYHFNNINFYFVKNNENELANIHFIFHQGNDHNQKLTLAINYLKYLGIKNKNAQTLAKDFYHLGINLNIYTMHDSNIISLSGLSKNLPKGIKLFENILHCAQSEEKLFHEFINNILKQKEDEKHNKNSLFHATQSYAIYGSYNPFTTSISCEELKKITAKELTEIITNITNYSHEIFYFGKNNLKILNILKKYHNKSKNITYPLNRIFTAKKGENLVYFINYNNMIQVEMSFYKRNQLFNKDNIAKSILLNEYFGYGLSSIVFQEIRESKSLGYAAFFMIKNANKQTDFDQTHAYLGTQVNKLKEAIPAMISLTKKFPKLNNEFQRAKETILKKISTSRVRKENIFWNYYKMKKLGIYHDINKEIYKQIKKITISDLEFFFNQTIKSNEYNYVIMGDINSIDFSVLKQLGTVKTLSVNDLFSK